MPPCSGRACAPWPRGRTRHDDGLGHAHEPDWHAHDEHGRGHAEEHAHADAHADGHPDPHDDAPADTEISWRGLLALGLSGGLVLSASALILLRGSIAAGRVAYGLVVVLRIGLGMAVVLAGIGLLIVNARRFVERRPSVAGLRRIVAPVQVVPASLVAVLPSQAVTQVL